MTDRSTDVTRRDVLSAAGAVALVASGALAGKAPLSQRKQTDKKVRMGIVGGGFGASFQWHLDPNCIVEGVSDLRQERRQRLQKVYKCAKAYESLAKLVKDDKIDAVAVFTGAPDHAKHVLAVMKSGKHCICAVPAGLTLDEMKQIKDVTERTGLKYMMAETTYYRPSCMLARELWGKGAFGDFLYSEVEYYHNHIGADKDGLSWHNGKRTWRYGYPPMLYPTHSTAFHVGVTGGRLTDVSCLGWAGRDKAFSDNAYDNPFANQSALFRTSGGGICRCNVFWRVHAHGERAQWLGQDMAMYMAGAAQPFVIRQPGKPDVKTCGDYFGLLPKPMRVRTGHGNSHTFLTHEFISAVLEARPPAVNVYEAIAMTAPGIVAMASSRKGGLQMKVPSFDPKTRAH